MSYLKIENLSKRYGAHQAVSGLSLEVEAGEIFGLLGPNGAGKTTTIQMIAGIITPTSGEVVIDGMRMSEHATRAKALIGYVPQELALYEELTATENLRFFASPYGIAHGELPARVDWALEVAGLGERSKGAVKHFSGGMKRRLNLVAGLIHRPRLLILDEPTVGVDPQSRFFLFEAIQRLRDEEGMTVLYTSHYIEEVETLCARVAIVDLGKLIACDSVDGLLSGTSTVVRIAFEAAGDAISRVLRELPEARAVGQELHVDLANSGRVLSRLQQEGITVRSVSSKEADLEGVFLRLTGHSLRDEES